MKQIELPPVWLAAFLAIAWAQSTYYPMGLSFGPVWADLLGGILVGAGLLLMLLAVVEFYKRKTTIIPRRESSAFVQSGIYRRTRNPIYLGDALVLAGLILRWDAVLSLPLIPIFIWVIEKRFIQGEEKHLRRTYRVQWATYERKVRRWL
ncbi:methyltransferase family protein [Profundibacter amoris]|uniref:Isoprenylcysteine carboxylmethyltransferase family protein n=1 Tax=Profundibacter amoris TaxID=2171755 RepID=A0A347UF39_9RHOB|nr:isoprenylcysteine carboxylmethyltransferase family protein [Profundibacter amoris]AXX97467.1 isoprenylcysteine carboxylmethyltransferase family protein [Profundibacter amoris]